MIKELIQQNDTTTVNIWAPNTSAQIHKYFKMYVGKNGTK